MSVEQVIVDPEVRVERLLATVNRQSDAISELKSALEVWQLIAGLTCLALIGIAYLFSKGIIS